LDYEVRASEFITEKKKKRKKTKVRRAAFGPGLYGSYGYFSNYGNGDSGDGGGDGGGVVKASSKKTLPMAVTRRIKAMPNVTVSIPKHQ
jgi:hypothetical protein